MKVYLELEKDIHFNFWKVRYQNLSVELFKLVYVQDMVMICEDEIAKLRKLEQMNSGGCGDGCDTN